MYIVGNFANADLNYLTNVLAIVIGLLLAIYAGKTIEIVEVQPDKNIGLDHISIRIQMTVGF